MESKKGKTERKQKQMERKKGRQEIILISIIKQFFNRQSDRIDFFTSSVTMHFPSVPYSA